MPAAHVIALLPETTTCQVVVAALRAAGHCVSLYTAPVALLANPPEETCDVLIVSQDSPQDRGLEWLAEIRGLAPQIPALVLGADFDLPTFVRALRLGVVDVVGPTDMPTLRTRVDWIRRAGAVAVLTDPTQDLLAPMLQEALQAAEQRGEAEAAQLEAEHGKLLEELAKLQAYEARLRDRERQVHDLEGQVREQAARRGGPGMSADWEKLERAKMRLEAEQRNFMTEQIVLREEMAFLRRRVAELTPYQAHAAEQQARLAAAERELAARHEALDRREAELLQREATQGIVRPARSVGSAAPQLGLFGAVRSRLSSAGR